MDSMRGLGRALASTTPRKSTKLDRAANVRQSFKTAALSVTNLYRAVAAEADEAYAEGYRDAVQDLVNFLDKADLGLTDGEGWMVREWATQRFQSSSLGGEGGKESGSGSGKEESAHRSSSPPSMQQDTHIPENEPMQRSEGIQTSEPEPRRQTPHQQSTLSEPQSSPHHMHQPTIPVEQQAPSRPQTRSLGPGAGTRRKADDDPSLHYQVKSSRRDHSSRAYPREKVAASNLPSLPNPFFDEFGKTNPAFPSFPGTGI
ncbi:hypothetical protein P152DRAFT_454154 [Eremomyces bilateralis CBS 781.70]|uniref:Uncharacterized protein n=1 Tax=Eremomyces bilateralis CBS 781.70 TaxID=1392243 RepID=A0A6G1GHP3_9PEZI|nr:uncharacterized protein P152DRAFT_454154 [Eremomyces bilateralis CBS 781.70]KAF1817573.1 hypothetical protein P152DRAFT_454154 [Eremomyces bilateralis CBS 781.70]